MAAIDRNEFETWMQTLRGDIKGVHDRLDALNGRTRTTEVGIAEIKVTLDAHGKDIEALHEQPASESHVSGLAAAAGGFAGGFIVVAGWLVEKFWK